MGAGRQGGCAELRLTIDDRNREASAASIVKVIVPVAVGWPTTVAVKVTLSPTTDGLRLLDETCRRRELDHHLRDHVARAAGVGWCHRCRRR